ncbi:homeobox protein BEL1 homolog isoform X1 [Diospyros lotus]|uniref:homeobox protein BEL1 homolog isoform X1 n=1 Tax=Diospyros lotus TaxID=55363 RepID=UPI00225A0EBC|nr:homeobox protein BEL1 homolog isoform X1 [Diospyros lotus]XP_052210628.1 homeobox protein BEL1 homolog isoform X1 [Diospyros lotus]
MCMAHQGGEEKHMNLASSAGYCYSDVSSHMANHHLQSFESNPEIYNLTTGMEIIGFPPKSLHQQTLFAKAGAGAGNHDPGGGPPSSSKTINESTGEFYGMSDTAEALMVAPDQSAVAAWQDQNRLLAYDSSMRCVFPCEGNERPSQGLSLSLSSTNPSTIRVQSFELRQQDNNIRPDGFFGKSMNIQQQMIQQDHGFFGKASNVHHLGHFQIRNSKYLGPAQELLNEFCNLGTKQTDPKLKIKPQKTQYWQDENASSSSKKQSLYSLDLLELQKRKTKLLSMLEELDRRYRHYCDQMKAVVSSFEAVAGSGAATVYSALASKAMSRHFRCLRDGIVNQIKAAKKAMGEKDTVAPGTTKGETPRLRLLDQTLRQQKAFQQMNLMESHPWRPQRGLPERSVSLLRAWLFEHFLHPYPSDVDKHILARQTGLSRSQVSNWFINARVRLWKPMVEEMYMEETKEQDNAAASSDDNGVRPRPEDHKPTAAQLGRIESECLSSIINNPSEKNDGKHSKAPHDHSFGRVAADTFSAVELDFSSYNHHATAPGGSSGGGVSLTLGLQQHGGNGVSLAFSPVSQGSLFYPREHIEDCQQVQYSLLDGEAPNLPYRNLMGAQLLHDLAG